MAVANKFKLVKCRLCLKLGDYLSIFTMDDSMQLAEMAMSCANIKIYEGDGLPDNVCAECVQKLSSAYVFKRQCESSDAQLRHNYKPLPGYRNSDSAVSSAHTDSISNHNEPTPSKQTPPNQNRKRSRESSLNDQRPGSAKSRRVEEHLSAEMDPNDEVTSESDSDEVDTELWVQQTDRTDPEWSSKIDQTNTDGDMFRCDLCSKGFESKLSLRSHRTHHLRTGKGDKHANKYHKRNTVGSNDAENELTCAKCCKVFRWKIMLKKHQKTCGKSRMSEPATAANAWNEKFDCKVCFKTISNKCNLKRHMTLVHNVGNASSEKMITCEVCTRNFSNRYSLQRHKNMVHGEVLCRKKASVTVPCVYCHEPFYDYHDFRTHFGSCPKRDDSIPLKCGVCDRVIAKRAGFVKHSRDAHFFPLDLNDSATDALKLTMRRKSVAVPRDSPKSSSLLVMRRKSFGVPRAAIDDGNSRGSAKDDSIAQKPQKSDTTGYADCKYCDKRFKYRKGLQNHLVANHANEVLDEESADKSDEVLRYEESADKSDGAVEIIDLDTWSEASDVAEKEQAGGQQVTVKTESK